MLFISRFCLPSRVSSPSSFHHVIYCNFDVFSSFRSLAVGKMTAALSRGGRHRRSGLWPQQWKMWSFQSRVRWYFDMINQKHEPRWHLNEWSALQQGFCAWNKACALPAPDFWPFLAQPGWMSGTLCPHSMKIHLGHLMMMMLLCEFCVRLHFWNSTALQPHWYQMTTF